METRASYAAVGAFVLVLVFALIGFVLWLGSSGYDAPMDRYRIYFSGSVTGLQVGSPVRFRGVPIGQVTAIAIDPQHPDSIPVTVDILETTPIRQDSVATLELTGITGGVYVQITGGQADSPPLSPVVDADGLPVIPSRPSSIQAVLTTLPQILDKVSALVSDVNQLLSVENRAALQDILGNVQALSDALAEQATGLAGFSEQTQSLMSNLDGLIAELRVDAARLSDRLDTTLAAAGGLTGEAQLTAADIRTMAASFTRTAGQIGMLIEGVRPGLQDFSETGLYEFSLMTSELRGLAQRLERVSTQLEQDPTQFLFGRSDQGVSPE